MARTAKKKIRILDEGVTLVEDADSINFTGPGNTGSAVGNDVTEDFPGGGTGSSTFIGLTDVPASYAGSALKIVRVNAAETGLEFVTLPGGGDMLASTYDPANIAEQLVGLTAVQTLTNKTLTAPKINENVVLTSTSTQLNYLGAATGTTGTTSSNVVFSVSPNLTTPNIGVATATSINGVTITSSTAVLTLASGKTVTINNTLTMNGTDGSTVDFGAGGTVAYLTTRLDQFAVPTATISMNGQLLSNLAAPVSGNDAVTKTYADALAVGLKWKTLVLVATTGNITLSGEQTIDGVATSASRVLVKDQTTATQNGVYVSAAGAWARATDCDTSAELESAAVPVDQGTVGAGKAYVQITNPVNLGVSNIVFVNFLSTTYAGTANRITVSGGTIDIASTYIGQTSITTLGTITTGVWNGSTIPVANGGTGITSFGAGIATWLGTPSSANLAAAVTDETGTGKLVFSTGPTFETIINIGVNATTLGKIKMFGSTSGDATLQPSVIAGTATVLSLPGYSGDLATLAGVETFTNKLLTAPKFASGGFIADINGNELFILTSTSSAVNELTFANAATGNNPKFTASGGDANIGFDFLAKGTGAYRFLGNATQAAEIRLYEDTDDGTNYSAFKVGVQSADLTYTLPTAYPSVTGYVLSATTGGVMSWISPGGIPTQITVANEATDTTCFPLFVTAATGDLGPKSNAAFTFNSNTGALASTLFSANTITANTAFVPDTNDGATLGIAATGEFSDVFLAEGAVINWDNGDATITQTGNTIALGGITAFDTGTSTAITGGTVELGHASDTTLSRSAAGTLAVEGVDVLTTSNTKTVTNKRNQPRIVSAASYTTDTGTSLDVSTCDLFIVTAQAGALKFNNPSGTPVQGEKLMVRIKDNGTARALTYDTQFRASSDLAFPTTTIISKTLYMGFEYNSTDTKWDLIAVLNNFT